MQSFSQPSVKCGNSVSKLSSDPIPSVKLRPGSKWAGIRWREEEEVVAVGDQLTDVLPRVQEPCLFSAGELEEGPGQVQIPPPSECVCGGEAVAQLP